MPGRQHEPQLRRGPHHQQLQLAQRLVRAQLVHVIDHQPQPVLQRCQVRQQPLHDRPPVQIRRRRQRLYQRRPRARLAQRGEHRQPQPLRIALIRPAGTHAARSARPASLIQDRSRTVLPLPGGADTTVTRADAASRSNSPGRETTPPHQEVRRGRARRPIGSRPHGPNHRTSRRPSGSHRTSVPEQPSATRSPGASGHARVSGRATRRAGSGG